MPMGMVVGGWLVQGTPVSYAKFYEVTSFNLATQLHHQLPIKEQRSYADRNDAFWADFGPRVNRGMSSLGDPSVTDGTALNIAPAQVAVNDTTLHVPALRVPLTSILTWWVTDFITQKSNPSPVGFGVMVPLPFN